MLQPLSNMRGRHVKVVNNDLPRPFFLFSWIKHWDVLIELQIVYADKWGKGTITVEIEEIAGFDESSMM